MEENVERYAEQLISLVSAGVADKKAAKKLLRTWLRPSVPSVAGGPPTTSLIQSMYRAASQRGSAAEHNWHLERVLAATDTLLSELKELRKAGYAHSDFWLHEEFGPIVLGQIERGDVFETLALIRYAAVESMDVAREGRPVELGRQRVVRKAYELMLQIAPEATIAEGPKNIGAQFLLLVYRHAVERNADFDDIRSVVREISREVKRGAYTPAQQFGSPLPDDVQNN